MHLRGRLLAVSVSCVVLLGGCSGDDQTDGTTPDSPKSVDPTVETRGDCDAEVGLTGKVKASWNGPGFVVTENRSGPVLYRAEEGKNRLTVLAADDQFDAIVNLTTPKGQFSSNSGGTLEVDPDGKGAEVDVDTNGGVHITASFDC